MSDHLAAGYASDDEHRPPPLARGYGALPGDKPRKRLSKDEVLDYQIRQASSGPASGRVRYIDAVLGRYDNYPGKCPPRLAPSQYRPRTSFERHCQLLSWLPKTHAAPKTDMDLLREAHRFLREEEDEDGSWEARLAQKYYRRLFREYVICDLAGYKKGHVGFRWRTEAEVVQGRGQFQCAHKRCESKSGLQSFEVDFKYSEAGKAKRALVKVRLCEPCAYKLHYRRLKAERRRRRKHKHKKGKKRSHNEDDLRRARKRAKEEPSSSEAVELSSDCDSAAAPAAAADTEHRQAPAPAEEAPSEEDRRVLEALAWKGPDPEIRTREDDFDDYFNDLLF